MSNNQNTDKNNNQPSFNEYQAYEELRMIFAIAIETQDFENFEARIAAWEKKYPLAEFQDAEIIRKIKAILNKDFLSRLLGDYLAAKVLHEQERQKESYDNLKKIIDKAKKTKNYKTAQSEVRKWKDQLHENGFSLYDFDRLYRARICTLLLLPSRELKNQEQATEELKKIKETGSTMNSEDYFKAISDWQNTYSIVDFPDKLKKELNEITTQVFDSISQKRTSENAISEIKTILESKDTTLPVSAIASVLSKYDYTRFPQEAIRTIESLSMQAMSIQETTLNDGIPDIDLSVFATVSPLEAQALVSLKDILNKTPHDMDTILNWIYTNRKINYSEKSRENIVKLFAKVGYKIPEQSSYAIPEIDSTINYKDNSKIDELRKTVILNYLGILSQGNKLSIEGKDNLVEARAISANQTLVEKESKPAMFVEVFDTIALQSQTQVAQEVDENEEEIYNIFIEDFMDNPLATYSISNSKTASSTKPKAVPEDKSTTSTSAETEYTPDIESVQEDTDTTTSEDSNSMYSLTAQDNENLDKIHDLSTYLIVASPILTHALEERTRLRKRPKLIERFKD